MDNITIPERLKVKISVLTYDFLKYSPSYHWFFYFFGYYNNFKRKQVWLTWKYLKLSYISMMKVAYYYHHLSIYTEWQQGLIPYIGAHNQVWLYLSWFKYLIISLILALLYPYWFMLSLSIDHSRGLPCSSSPCFEDSNSTCIDIIKPFLSYTCICTHGLFNGSKCVNGDALN